MRHIHSSGHEPTVHAVIGKSIEKVLHQGLISDLHGPEENVKATPSCPECLKSYWIYPIHLGYERLIFRDEQTLLGLFYEPRPKLGMGTKSPCIISNQYQNHEEYKCH